MASTAVWIGFRVCGFEVCWSQSIEPRYSGESVSDEGIVGYKYVCVATNQPDTKFNPNPNPTTKQRAVASIQLNIVTCPIHIQRNSYVVVAPFFKRSVVIVTLPLSGRPSPLAGLVSSLLH